MWLLTFVYTSGLLFLLKHKLITQESKPPGLQRYSLSPHSWNQSLFELLQIQGIWAYIERWLRKGPQCKYHSHMETQKCEPTATLSDRQRVWRLLKMVDKCSYPSRLRMWLLGSFDVKMAYTSRSIPSWQMVRICKHNFGPSFVIGDYLGNGCLLPSDYLV